MRETKKERNKFCSGLLLDYRGRERSTHTLVMESCAGADAVAEVEVEDLVSWLCELRLKRYVKPAIAWATQVGVCAVCVGSVVAIFGSNPVGA